MDIINEHITVWSSDNTVLRIGTGNVDGLEIISGGNIVNYPQVTSTIASEATDCVAGFVSQGNYQI